MKNKNITTKFTDNVNMFLKASRMQNKQTSQKEEIMIGGYLTFKKFTPKFFHFLSCVKTYVPLDSFL